jgi:cell division protein FtsB
MLLMTSAVPSLDTIALRADLTALDLSDLSSETLMRLRMSVSEFRSSGRRLIGELYVMTQQLCIMRDILGERFRTFVDAELGLAPRMISRYMHINKVLNTHFSVDGQIDLNEANAFTQRALALLSPSTDTQVVEELRELASQGTTIDHNVVMNALNQAEADAVAQLASTQADLTAKTRQLAEMAQQREVERARNQREVESQAEMLRRAEQRRNDLEEEITKLRSQETQVRFEEKEVVPAGYASVEEAISAKTRELESLVGEREAVSAEISTLTEQQKKLQDAVQQTSASASQFLAMKEQADTLIAQFPIALLKSLSEKDPTVKAAIASLGETFVLFGQQLAKAGA